MARQSVTTHHAISIVKSVLGKRRSREMTRSEIESLARVFVRAGRMAVAAKPLTRARAGDLVGKAKRDLAGAWEWLARVSGPGSPPVHVDREWRDAMSALQAGRAKLSGNKNIVGFKIGYRMREGVELPETCVCILVDEKKSEHELQASGMRNLPRWLPAGSGKRIPTDVVETGRLVRHVKAGENIGAVLNPPSSGTMGAFAIDRTTRRTVGITAMHVAGGHLSGTPGSDQAGVDETTPSRMHDAGARVFGRLLRGTSVGTDAAAILLSPGEPAEPSPLGRITSCRPVVAPADKGTRVRMYGAISKYLSGSITDPFLSLDDESIDAAFGVDIDSQKGDSGSALIDDKDTLLGFLVGALPRVGPRARVCVSAVSVLQVLDCELSG